MKVLYIGDPHVKVSNLEESEKLMHFVNDTVLKYSVDRTVILGDLQHTHAVVRVEVLDFWDSWLDTLSEAQELVVLIGNHDFDGQYNSFSHSLSVFKWMGKSSLHIVETPLKLGPFLYISYMRNPNKFIELANYSKERSPDITTLVCHQTFQGSVYENGFQVPDGINKNLLNFDNIISGHIHRRQRYEKIIYPGTPRWDSISDANEPKGIWLVEHDDITGKILNEQFIDTSEVCKPIISVTWREGEEQPVIKENSKTVIELIGSSAWITLQKQLLKNKVSIKTKITDSTKLVNRKAGKNIEDFIKNHYKSLNNIDKNELIELMKEFNFV